MLSRQDAIARAEREIANLSPLPVGDSWIIYVERTIERPFGWVVFYGSRLYTETGEARYAVAGNAPFIVNRSTGAVVPTGTSQPLECYIAEYEERLGNQSN
jgi:hypothetical protein